MLLQGGSGSRVMVGYVAPGSKAQRAGVQEGCALLAINNSRQFNHLPGWHVRMLLRAPCTLYFELVQPAQKGPSEIRVRRLREETIGIPLRVGVCGPSDEGVLAEEVVFKPNAGPLWLLSGKGQPALAGPSSREREAAFAISGTDGAPRTADPSQGAAASAERTGSRKVDSTPLSEKVYELQRKEANDLIGKALLVADAAAVANSSGGGLLSESLHGGALTPPQTSFAIPRSADHSAPPRLNTVQQSPNPEGPQSARMQRNMKLCDDLPMKEVSPTDCMRSVRGTFFKPVSSQADGNPHSSTRSSSAQQNSHQPHRAGGDNRPESSDKSIFFETPDPGSFADLRHPGAASSSAPVMGQRVATAGAKSMPSFGGAAGPIIGTSGTVWWASQSPMVDVDGMLRSHSSMSVKGPRRTSPQARRADGDAPPEMLMSAVPEPVDKTVANASEVARDGNRYSLSAVDETIVDANEGSQHPMPLGPHWIKRMLTRH